VLLRIARKKRTRREGGFTLIEVLIAMLLLLIGVAGVLSLQLVSMKSTSYSRTATEATVAAEDKMEELSAIPTADLVSGGDIYTTQGTNYTVTWTVTDIVGPVPVELRRLSVLVQWFGRAGELTQKSIRLDTMRRVQ
jgi:prepilin-type N-terminal cleavage/methylation domain-containing protein